ncbi:hypothetical protein VIGAN_11169100 [Vigna angularis var. angularis]|uniref:Uncharacterized protein n=1 Tax=Vigna angularis var. angularis TaxID=157739 RepID=A0A0S3TB84_PHAAN|nr:hypothetical protein VIGAN_11169100 [Vigna angularis var. angularis]
MMKVLSYCVHLRRCCAMFTQKSDPMIRKMDQNRVQSGENNKNQNYYQIKWGKRLVMVEGEKIHATQYGP